MVAHIIRSHTATLACTVLLLTTSLAPTAQGVPLRSVHQPAGSPQLAIIGGEATGRCKWPWMAAIMTATSHQFVCGATLISSQWLLTAAHCVYNAPVELNVVLGAYNLTERDEVFNIPIRDIIVHPAYDPSSYGINDIALLHLNAPVDLSASDCVKAINLPLPNYNPILNIECYITGWGRTSLDADAGVSDILTEKNVDIISNALCQLRWNKSIFGNAQIYPPNVCIDESQNVSACQGDSGSPLQCYVADMGWTIVGLSSWGSSACKKYPSVYMRVSSFDSWIIGEMTLFSQSNVFPAANTTVQH